MSFILSLLLTTQAVALPGEEALPPVDWARQLGIEEEQRDPATGEFPVDPYRQSNANAGATPVGGARLADQFGGPTSSKSIAKALCAIAQIYESKKDLDWGTYHFTQQPHVSWYQFAEEIIRQAHEKNALEIEKNAGLTNAQKSGVFARW